MKTWTVTVMHDGDVMDVMLVDAKTFESARFKAFHAEAEFIKDRFEYDALADATEVAAGCEYHVIAGQPRRIK
jgi:hypothetical protein